MNSRQILQNIKNIDDYIKTLEQDLKDRHSLLCSVSALKYDVDKIDKSKGNYSEDKIIEYMTLYDNLQKEILKLVREKERLAEEINKIENVTHRQILYDRYVNCRSIKEICKLHNYSRRSVFRLLRDAIKELEKCSQNFNNYDVS